MNTANVGYYKPCKNNPMCKSLRIYIFLCTLFVSGVAEAQSTRTLSGTLTLDVTPSQIDREIEITIRNHAFVVIPPNFAILRPITSSESTIITMPAGSSRVNYSLSNIITAPVDYSISIRCLGCASDFPLQYYTLSGNTFALGLSAFIDPEDLSSQLNITAITRATIKGEIALEQIAERNLRFTITVFSEQDSGRAIKTVSPITLQAGTKAVAYSITGLDRAIDLDRYRVKLKCINCSGQSAKVHVFLNALSPNQNHSNINFSVTDISVPTLASILLMLIE